MANLLKTGIQAGSGILGQAIFGGLNRRHERRLNEQTIKAQKEMSEYAYGKDLEQWKRQNEYNLPSAQMERLKDAGLNPNLIYGSGSGNTVASEGPKYQAPRPEYDYTSGVPTGIPDVLSKFTSLKQANAQIDNIKSMTRLNEEKKEHETFKTLLTNASIGTAQARSEMDQHLSKFSKEFAEQKFRQLQLGNNLNVKNLEKRTKEMDLLDQDLVIKKAISQIKTGEADWQKTMKSTEVGKNIMGILRILRGIF